MIDFGKRAECSICVTNPGVCHARARFTSQESDYVERVLRTTKLLRDIHLPGKFQSFGQLRRCRNIYVIRGGENRGSRGALSYSLYVGQTLTDEQRTETAETLAS